MCDHGLQRGTGESDSQGYWVNRFNPITSGAQLQTQFSSKPQIRIERTGLPWCANVFGVHILCRGHGHGHRGLEGRVQYFPDQTQSEAVVVCIGTRRGPAKRLACKRQHSKREHSQTKRQHSQTNGRDTCGGLLLCTTPKTGIRVGPCCCVRHQRWEAVPFRSTR